jgi:hypothetical protein
MYERLLDGVAGHLAIDPKEAIAEEVRSAPSVFTASSDL